MSIAAHVLVIAGTDSSGGAGLVRDVEVITELGARACCAVTVVTAQTSSSVEACSVIAPELIRQQLRTALRSHAILVIKIGMLGTGEIVRTVLEELPDRREVPIVVDPVLRSTSGAALLDPEGMELLRDQLLPRCSLMTPNLIEASVLLDEPVALTNSEQAAQAQALLRFGSQAVLLKGGHGAGDESVDVLANPVAPPTWLRAQRLAVSMRGTGCALSSAIAAFMATGLSMESACARAKTFVYDKLSSLRAASRADHKL